MFQLYNYKFNSLLQRTLLAPIFISWAIAEVHRIYFGCKGNIKEMVRVTYGQQQYSVGEIYSVGAHVDYSFVLGERDKIATTASVE